jgi:hypothetical protein
MTEGDGLGIIVFFTVILGVIWGELKSRTKPKPINDKVKRIKKRKIKDDPLRDFEDIEYPEEDYPDKTDADLIEFDL